jgi:hypothetical protein
MISVLPPLSSEMSRSAEMLTGSAAAPALLAVIRKSFCGVSMPIV